MSAYILVVEDEPAIAESVAYALRRDGFSVGLAANLAEAEAQRDQADLVVLDLMLPDGSGFDFIGTLRAARPAKPVIVLSSRDGEADRVAALETGADDYVTKPFSMPELLARLRVAVRHRTRPAGAVGPEQAVLEVGDLVVDVAHHRVTLGGEPVELTPKEFAFLTMLARYPGRVLTHRAILQAVWGPEYGTVSQYLRVYASHLRKKLRDDPDHPRLVTEPGVGYRLVDPFSSSSSEPT